MAATREQTLDAVRDSIALVLARLRGDRAAQVAIIRANESNAAGLVAALLDLAAGSLMSSAHEHGQDPVEYVALMLNLVNAGAMDQILDAAQREAGGSDA